MHEEPRVDAAAVAKAVEVLLGGGLVAFPTETVYGLGADADQPAALASIFRAKDRPPAHPLIVHVAHADAARQWARQIPPPARILMERYWPGPLTLILPRTERAGDVVTGGQDTVGLRCPSHPWAQALLREFCAGRGDAAAAIAAPSANRYGRISPTRAQHVRSDLGEKPAGSVDFILDGGVCTLGIESTIVEFSRGRTRILRPGSIDRVQLAQTLETPVDIAGDAQAGPRVSGRIAGHYAPAKPLELVSPLVLAARAAALPAVRLAVLAPAAVLAQTAAANVVVRREARDEPEEYARALYEELRGLDASVAQRLLVAMPPPGERWDAVRDRLRRAAAGSRPGRLDDAD